MGSHVPGPNVLGQVTAAADGRQPSAPHSRGVAYDLNNLLTVIIGYTDLSLRKGGLEDSIRHNLEEIKQASERAACLIRRLRDASTQPIIETNAARGFETILLVEDDDLMRAMTRKILMEAGYYVLDVGSGEEAIRLGRDYGGPINLLLTDVVMPKMCGREVAEHLLELRPTAGVLFMSGYTDDAIERHGGLHANADLIQKPFTWVSLAKRVRDVLDQINSSSISHQV